MSDSWGDGWNTNILGIKQNNTIVGTFGDNFDSGSFGGSVYITVQGNLATSVVVTHFGSYTQDIAFTIKVPNGTIIYQRTSGTPFSAGFIFAVFCPIGGCPVLTTLQLTITMSDSYGDGWNGNILGIKQNNTMVGTFGSNFTTGSSSGPVYITVQGNQ